jgi:hypothetical protein
MRGMEDEPDFYDETQVARKCLSLMGQALIIDIEGESGEASRETSVEESRGDWSGPLPKNRIAIETR